MHRSDNRSADTSRWPTRPAKLWRSAGWPLIALQLLVAALPSVWAAAAQASVTALAELPATWRDDRGETFDLRAMQGHAVVLTMAYATCHRVCPMTLRRLQELQRGLDRQGIVAEFLVIGYDPDRDDAAAWHQYRETRHLTRNNWHFLVGTRATVEQAARQLGFKFWRYDEHVMHDSRILHFDRSGTVTRIDEATEPESTQR